MSSASPSKDIKTFFIKAHAVIPHPIEHFTNGSRVNVYLTSIVDRKYHGLAITLVSVQLLLFFSYARVVVVTTFFTIDDDMFWLCDKK